MCDFIAAMSILAVTCSCFLKRPRTTSTIVCAWIAWFGLQLARGHSAWQEVLEHAESAAKSTAGAVRANGDMLVAWVTLVLPAVYDLWRLVCPILLRFLVMLQWMWTCMSWEQRGILALCGMGIGGTAYAVMLLWKSRSWLRHNSNAFFKSAKHVLFHVSFIAVCPTVWLAASLCPSDVVPCVVFFLLGTLLPVLWTSRALIQHDHEKDAQTDEETRSQTFSWLPAIRWRETFSPSADLEQEMRYLLSYWACWPLLCAIQFSVSRLPNKTRPGAEGLLIALTMWLQYWRGSFLAPYLFTLLTSLLSHTIEHLYNLLDAGRQAACAILQRPTCSIYLLSLCPHERWAMVAAGVLLLVFCLEVASVVSVLITVGLLFGIALESARCVAGNTTQMYANRLSFWVLVNVWFWVLKVPVLGGVLSLWSPVMFGLAFVGGEAAFSALTGLLLRLLARIVSALSKWCEHQTSRPLEEALLEEGLRSEEKSVAESPKDPARPSRGRASASDASDASASECKADQTDFEEKVKCEGEPEVAAQEMPNVSEGTEVPSLLLASSEQPRLLPSAEGSLRTTAESEAETAVAVAESETNPLPTDAAVAEVSVTSTSDVVGSGHTSNASQGDLEELRDDLNRSPSQMLDDHGMLENNADCHAKEGSIITEGYAHQASELADPADPCDNISRGSQSQSGDMRSSRCRDNSDASPKPHGKISVSKNISTLDYVSKHKSFVPGPTYVPPPWAKMGKPFCPEGGRFMLEAHKPPSYFDVAPKLYDANPPPGSYDAKGSVEVKVVGELVYRYESATSSETKALIAKVVGDPEEVPGPGHYTLPDPLPLAAPPALKGRMLPYSMPHPYAYNCAPDHTRSFLEPVRRRNNADQIFGTGWRQGAARRGDKGKPSSKEDQVQLAELPPGVGEEEKPDDDGVVHWRSGGFSIKKSRSTAGVRAPEVEREVLEGVGKFYPPLAQKHQRCNSQFLPMSSRRTESVRTRGASEENQRLGQSKWKLSKALEGIQNATNAALEPLDVDKLKQHAMKGLRDKAINRMKLQGVSKDQQEVILEEMDALLRERSERVKAAQADSQDLELEEDIAGPLPDAHELESPDVPEDAVERTEDAEADAAALDAAHPDGIEAPGRQTEE
ncbi:unnamed protein product [Symbiodinium sp. CCMP2456]|nr:unnamed protein product [Symbiodinium sp. CCMP2456]